MIKNTETIQEEIDKLRALQSPVVQQAFLNDIERLWPGFLDSDLNEVKITSGCVYTFLYDELTDIWDFKIPDKLYCDDKCLRVYYDKTYICPDYNNAEVRLVISESQPLAKGDLGILELLGHVKTEILPAHINRTIYCASSFSDIDGLPF